VPLAEYFQRMHPTVENQRAVSERDRPLSFSNSSSGLPQMPRRVSTPVGLQPPWSGVGWVLAGGQVTGAGPGLALSGQGGPQAGVRSGLVRIGLNGSLPVCDGLVQLALSCQDRALRNSAVASSYRPSCLRTSPRPKCR